MFFADQKSTARWCYDHRGRIDVHDKHNADHGHSTQDRPNMNMILQSPTEVDLADHLGTFGASGASIIRETHERLETSEKNQIL